MVVVANIFKLIPTQMRAWLFALSCMLALCHWHSVLTTTCLFAQLPYTVGSQEI